MAIISAAFSVHREIDISHCRSSLAVHRIEQDLQVPRPLRSTLHDKVSAEWVMIDEDELSLASAAFLIRY